MSYAQNVISLFDIVTLLESKNRLYLVYDGEQPHKIINSDSPDKALKHVIIELFLSHSNYPHLMYNTVGRIFSRDELRKTPANLFNDYADKLGITCKIFHVDLLIECNEDLINHLLKTIKSARKRRELFDEIINAKRRRIEWEKYHSDINHQSDNAVVTNSPKPYRLTLFDRSSNAIPSMSTDPYFTNNPKMS